MKTRQARISASKGWDAPVANPKSKADLVLAFGAPDLLCDRNLIGEIQQAHPEAILAGCSTAGEILGTEVTDDSLVLSAISFERTRMRSVTLPLDSADNSHSAGAKIAGQLVEDDLVHVLVFSEGLHVNGSKLAKGINQGLPRETQVTGGLAGDGENFDKTFILADGVAAPDRVVAVGFYGNHLKSGCGSLGGWDPFGPERLITRSEGNVLQELDGRSALEIYRRYLGPYEKDLPASALLFPLALRLADGEPSVVRTVLAIDDKRQTMTFAGDMPAGAYARFMKANFDRLVGGATRAATLSREALGAECSEFALLISCVGRKMVLKQKVEEEVEGVRRVLGDTADLAGFYSYGEISPFSPDTDCRLHNQTMTITTFKEV
jgi:hypothetical protein